MLNADQVRMARAALRWGIRDLAKYANVTTVTVTRIEKGKPAHAATLQALRTAFEDAGLEFIPATADSGAGVKFRRPKTEIASD
jgi:transcriptional regulator with XRE-family HTH domain